MGAKWTAARIGIAAALGGAAMLVGGCELLEQEEEWKPEQPAAISVSEDGVITEYLKDTLDEAYYSAPELESMVKSEIHDYNSGHGADSVVLKEFVSEGQEVRVTLEYAQPEDYAQFNNVEFYSGSMIGAQLEGYLFDDAFQLIDNGAVKASGLASSEALKKMAAEVMVVTAPLEVNVPGNVIFTTMNAEMIAADDVNATGKTGEEEEGLVLPSNAVYKGEEKSLAEKAAANRVYIIYEIESYDY